MYVCFNTDSIVSPTKAAPLYIGVMIDTNSDFIYVKFKVYYNPFENVNAF